MSHRGGGGGNYWAPLTRKRHIPPRGVRTPAPPPLCDIPSGCCFCMGPWTVTRSSLRMLRRVTAFCRPLWPALLLVSSPRSRGPVVGVPGLCWMLPEPPGLATPRGPGRQLPPLPQKEEKERTKGKESLWVLRAPVRKMILQIPHPRRAQVSAGVSKLGMDSECASGCTWSTARAPARLRDSRPPRVAKQDKSSGGSIDTTKTRSDPQRVRMSSGETPIGAAKGKQPNTAALCQPPPPPQVGGLRPTVSCKRRRPQASMGAEGAQCSTGTKGARRKILPHLEPPPPPPNRPS